MKDEIKEILQLIGDCCYYGKISVDKCEKYCNYITNLQERCEYLERSNNRREDEIKEKCIDCEYSRQCFTMKQINSECCLKDRENEKKNEIKEILDIERYRNKDGYVENIILLPNEIHKLLDYITNLQTIEQQYSAILSENAELENKITNLQEETERQSKAQVILDNQIAEMLKYKERNEKAIEFLEHFDSGQQCEHTKDLAIIVKNILKGEDKE